MRTSVVYTGIIVVLAVVVAALLISGTRGTITGLTTLEQEICNTTKCSSNTGCNDNNECTRDICFYPGECDSYCYYEMIKDCVKVDIK